MSVTSAAVAAGRSAAGSSAASSNIPGFGSPFGRATGNRGGLMGMTQKLMQQARARALARKGGAVGNASVAVGGNDGRFTSIESRLEALEGGGDSGDFALDFGLDFDVVVEKEILRDTVPAPDIVHLRGGIIRAIKYRQNKYEEHTDPHIIGGSVL